MKREVGLNVRDHVRQVMRRSINPSLHPRINRHGTYGKHKYPDVLLTILISSNFMINSINVQYYQRGNNDCAFPFYDTEVRVIPIN